MGMPTATPDRRGWSVLSPTAAAAASCGGGADRISWAAATFPAVHDFLTTCYPDVFVLGRIRSEKRIEPTVG